MRRNFSIEDVADILQALQVIDEACLGLAHPIGALQALGKPDGQLFRFVVVRRFTRLGCDGGDLDQEIVPVRLHLVDAKLHGVPVLNGFGQFGQLIEHAADAGRRKPARKPGALERFGNAGQPFLLAPFRRRPRHVAWRPDLPPWRQPS